jgi:hypothetical protein
MTKGRTEMMNVETIPNGAKKSTKFTRDEREHAQLLCDAAIKLASSGTRHGIDEDTSILEYVFDDLTILHCDESPNGFSVDVLDGRHTVMNVQWQESETLSIVAFRRGDWETELLSHGDMTRQQAA